MEYRWLKWLMYSKKKNWVETRTKNFEIRTKVIDIP